MSIRFFFLLLALFSGSVGLKDNCVLRFRTVLVKRCVAPSKPCCNFVGPCSLRHEVRGIWVTEKDMKADAAACSTACDRHFEKCLDKCKCGVQNYEVKSGRFCKCKREEITDQLVGRCQSFCKDAREKCVTACTSGKCPLRARTVLNWRQEVRGKCLPFCAKLVSVLTRPPACPLPVESKV